MTDRVITKVYNIHGQLSVFDQEGKEMHEFEGPVAEFEPKVRAAGFKGGIPVDPVRSELP